MKRLILFVALLLCGCGYHFPGHGGALPGGVKKLHIPLFVNRTAEPLLENEISNSVSEVLSRNSNISLVDSADVAEAILEGEVQSYSAGALSYDKNDDISEYRATVTIAVRLRQAQDGRLLWQGKLSWNEDYQAADDKAEQENLEQAAIETICLRLAEELLYRMMDDF